MNSIFHIIKELLLEQDGKLSDLQKAITKKLPISIYYSGPSKEVLSGQRIDILPIALGPHIKSGNLVIWAFVYKGMSKRGIPNWKMFRVDRIKSLKFNPKLSSFDLDTLPDYDKDKAPNMMKSLSRVDAYSPYMEERPEEEPVTPSVTPSLTPSLTPSVAPSVAPSPEPPEGQPETTIPSDQPLPQAGPVEKPGTSARYLSHSYNELKTKVTDANGKKTINQNDYQTAIDNLRRKKEDEWKVYQRMLTGHVRPGEGTRKRFTDTSKNDIDRLLSKDNISVSNEMPENLSEIFRRFKDLIK